MSCLERIIKIEIFLVLSYIMSVISGIIGNWNNPYLTWIMTFLFLHMIFGLIQIFGNLLIKKNGKESNILETGAIERVPIFKDKYASTKLFLGHLRHINKELGDVNTDTDPIKKNLVYKLKNEIEHLCINLEIKN